MFRWLKRLLGIKSCCESISEELKTYEQIELEKLVSKYDDEPVSSRLCLLEPGETLDPIRHDFAIFHRPFQSTQHLHIRDSIRRFIEEYQNEKRLSKLNAQHRELQQELDWLRNYNKYKSKLGGGT